MVYYSENWFWKPRYFLKVFPRRCFFSLLKDKLICIEISRAIKWVANYDGRRTVLLKISHVHLMYTATLCNQLVNLYRYHDRTFIFHHTSKDVGRPQNSAIAFAKSNWIKCFELVNPRVCVSFKMSSGWISLKTIRPRRGNYKLRFVLYLAYDLRARIWFHYRSIEMGLWRVLEIQIE